MKIIFCGVLQENNSKERELIWQTTKFIQPLFRLSKVVNSKSHLIKMIFGVPVPTLEKVRTKHFYINIEKEIQAEHQNYLKWLLLESFAYCARFGTTYDDSILAGFAAGVTVRYGETNQRVV